MAQVCFSDFILKSRFREMTSGFISHIVLQYLQKLFFFFYPNTEPIFKKPAAPDYLHGWNQVNIHFEVNRSSSNGTMERNYYSGCD